MADGHDVEMDEASRDPGGRSDPAAPPACDASMKYAPFYEDVYNPAFFGTLLNFTGYGDAPFAEDPDGVLAASLFARRSVYPSVPTEETSLVGRERRKQSQKRKKDVIDARPFNYLSAVCGAEFPTADLDPFFQPHAPDKISAVHAPTVSDAVDEAVYHPDVAAFFQQLLTDASPLPESQLNDNAEAGDGGQATQLSQSDVPDVGEEALRRKRGCRGVGDGADGVREGVLTTSDDVTECIAVLAPKIKRKRTTKENAKRKGCASEGRSSRFRGVTKHRRSGRWEAHIWIKEMGRQVYLGGYEKEEHAAEAYDVAAIKSKGDKVKTNFDLSKYKDLRAVMDSITMDELVMIVRRQSQGFSRGTSVFRGVTHHPSGRWEARIGIPGSKHIYLGLYNDEYEAAKWYDRALVRLRGPTAATNFLLSNYHEELAEHQELQHALQGDAAQKGMTALGVNFEHWVKFGRKGLEVNFFEPPITQDPNLSHVSPLPLEARLHSVDVEARALDPDMNVNVHDTHSSI